MPVSPFYITHIQYLSEWPMRTNACRTHWRKEWIQIRDYCILLGQPTVSRWTWQAHYLEDYFPYQTRLTHHKVAINLASWYPAVMKWYCSPKYVLESTQKYLQLQALWGRYLTRNITPSFISPLPPPYPIAEFSLCFESAFAPQILKHKRGNRTVPLNKLQPRESS
jgi:hypothetical protein